VRGLRTKLCELRSAVLSTFELYNILILVETWLVICRMWSWGLRIIIFLDLIGTLVRVCILEVVMIAVKNSLFSRELRTSIDCVEQIFININIGHKHVIVGAVYIPPSSDVDVYMLHTVTLSRTFF